MRQNYERKFHPAVFDTTAVPYREKYPFLYSFDRKVPRDHEFVEKVATSSRLENVKVTKYARKNKTKTE